MKKRFTQLGLYGLIAAAVCLLNPAHIRAQVTVIDSVEVATLVNEMLLGSGITAENITYNGEPAEGLFTSKLGSFTADSTAFPIAEGVVMGTGQATGLAGGSDVTHTEPNFQDDADLVAISGGFTMNNCAILEFDFTADTDSFLIDYIFASTEYPNFTCTAFNDAFGIFLSGPGISGPFTNNAENIALIPQTDIPVSINSVNGGAPTGAGTEANCLAANPNFVEDSIYFFNNQPQLENSIAYPGHTHMFTAVATLVPGETYHFKFAIANASDQALQSAVVMRKGSVSSGLVTSGLQIDVNTEGIQEAPEGIFIAGTFNYFVPEPMEQVGANLYRFSAPVPPHVNVTYKFFNGNGPDAAELVPEDCSVSGLMPDGSRHLTMPEGPLAVPPVCFGTCEVCSEILTVHDSAPETLKIFPNPTSGQVQLVPPADGQARVQAFDVQGRLIVDRQAYVNGGNPMELDFPAKGMYKLLLYYTDRSEAAYTGTVVVQ